MVKTQSAPNEDGLYEFHWSPETIGYVDSSYFWGYVVTQVPGGFLASYIPANRLFGFAILFNSCLNLLIPTLTQLEPLCVIIARVLQVKSWCFQLKSKGTQISFDCAQGLLDGVTFPCVQSILCWWSPPEERTILSTIILAGSFAGAAVGIPLSGPLFCLNQISNYVKLSFRISLGFPWMARSVLQLRAGRNDLVRTLVLAELRETVQPSLHLSVGKVSH